MASSIEYVVLSGFKVVLGLVVVAALSSVVMAQVDKIGAQSGSGFEDFDAKFIVVEEEHKN